MPTNPIQSDTKGPTRCFFVADDSVSADHHCAPKNEMRLGKGAFKSPNRHVPPPAQRGTRRE